MFGWEKNVKFPGDVCNWSVTILQKRTPNSTVFKTHSSMTPPENYNILWKSMVGKMKFAFEMVPLKRGHSFIFGVGFSSVLKTIGVFFAIIPGVQKSTAEYLGRSSEYPFHRGWLIRSELFVLNRGSCLQETFRAKKLGFQTFIQGKHINTGWLQLRKVERKTSFF